MVSNAKLPFRQFVWAQALSIPRFNGWLRTQMIYQRIPKASLIELAQRLKRLGGRSRERKVVFHATQPPGLRLTYFKPGGAVNELSHFAAWSYAKPPDI